MSVVLSRSCNTFPILSFVTEMSYQGHVQSISQTHLFFSMLAFHSHHAGICHASKTCFSKMLFKHDLKMPVPHCNEDVENKTAIWSAVLVEHVLTNLSVNCVFILNCLSLDQLSQDNLALESTYNQAAQTAVLVSCLTKCHRIPLNESTYIT